MSQTQTGEPGADYGLAPPTRAQLAQPSARTVAQHDDLGREPAVPAQCGRPMDRWRLGCRLTQAAQLSPSAAPAKWRERTLDALLCTTAAAAFFSISFMQVAFIAALLLWLTAPRQRLAPELRPLLWALLAYSVGSLLAASLAADRLRAFSALRELGLPALVFLAAERLSQPRLRERFFITLDLATLLAVAVGLYQSGQAGLGYRIHGSLGHYMTYAGVLLSASMAALARTLFAPDLRARILPAITVAASAVALLLTQTRSAWLGWCAGAALLLVLWRKAALLALPLLALACFFSAPAPLQQRMLSTFDRKNVTAVERTYMWRAGTNLWLDHFFCGVGPDNLRSAYPAYKLPDDPWLPERKFTHLHNNPLQIAAERGLCGLLAWLAIYAAYTWAAIRSWLSTSRSDVSRRAAIGASCAALLAFHVSGVFEYNFGNSEVATLVWLLLALVYAKAQRQHQAA